jgi:hypothetical protein
VHIGTSVGRGTRTASASGRRSQARPCPSAQVQLAPRDCSQEEAQEVINSRRCAVGPLPQFFFTTGKRSRFLLCPRLPLVRNWERTACTSKWTIGELVTQQPVRVSWNGFPISRGPGNKCALRGLGPTGLGVCSAAVRVSPPSSGGLPLRGRERSPSLQPLRWSQGLSANRGLLGNALDTQQCRQVMLDGR